VGEVAFPSTSYTDNHRDLELGEILESDKVRMPPADLKNITAINGLAKLAGTTGHMVHMSRNMQPYNWPVQNDITLDYHPVHMGNIDGTLIVSTDGRPYVIDATTCEPMKCTPVSDIDYPLPDIGCGYPNSAITTPYGLIYSSYDGLVLVDVKGTYNVITSKWFSTDDWREVRPESVRLAYWRGYLFCVTDALTFLLELDGNTFSDSQGGELTTLSDHPVDMKVSANGVLFMMEDGVIYQWEAGTTLRPYEWVSRELFFSKEKQTLVGTAVQDARGYETVFTSVKIKSQYVNFDLITPLEGVHYARPVTGEKPFRLPRLGRHLWYKIKLSGTQPVEFVELGSSNFTVNAGV
jgi:hypothetical protein